MSFENGNGIATSAATAYIKDRGCTSELRRLPALDVFDPASNTWTIGISC